jgi:DNA-binding transcriptional LysR family regulator
MDLRQLRALVAVADHQSFSAAARSLHTVQSNISTHIARLERELGAVLVDRSNGNLTPEGRSVVERARRIDAELSAIDADVASLAGEIRGEVRLGMIGTTGRWLVPQLLERLADRAPQIHLVVVDATTTSLVPQIGTGRLDSAVVNLPVDDPDLDTEVLFEEDHVIIAPLDHPLAKAPEVDLAELAEHDLLMPPPGTTLRDTIDKSCRAAGITLHTKAEVDGVRLLASLAFQGYGAALVPASAVPAWLAGSWTRVHVRGLPRRAVGLATSRRFSPPAPARVVREVLREIIATAATQQPGLYLP